MMRSTLLLLFATVHIHAAAPIPESLVADGIPPIPEGLRPEVGRYLEFRSAGFLGWHPSRREMLITTRFADTSQVHLVKMPGGARKQLTFGSEPIATAGIQPELGRCFVYAQDAGGGEFYQLYRFDFEDSRATLLTDGKSRNTGADWSHDGKRLAYTSTRRNGRDNDVRVIDPFDPKADREVLQVSGGGWSVSDWSHDHRRLLLQEYLSVNESRLHLLDLESGKVELLTPPGPEKVSWGAAIFARDDRSVLASCDQGSEFARVVRLDLATKAVEVLTKDLAWDVQDLVLSPDGSKAAIVSNEEGASVLRILDARTGALQSQPKLPLGVMSGLEWTRDGRELGFSFNSARSPTDAWSLDVATGAMTRWTESETGGLDPSKFSEPELVRATSFDGVKVSGFLYRPDAKKFPGPRPVIVNIHGGPEGQSRPIFQARNNYLLNELGVAIFYPNVRGSDGYGKTFLTLDNGFKREDSVRDIGAFLEALAKDPGLDRARFAVMGGSYGGYMTLATLVHFSERLRCGIDVVGISNFLSFLKNTQDYRRDLRRVEYGDERDPAMAAHLGKISPLNNVTKITRPLLVVQGKNDPRVPASEAEQIVKAVRGTGQPCWYLLANDEGHGFAKKTNADFQFLAQIVFLREYLMK
jgi:dipeptidyl aminopeptidase/acylaminoacyl peptidase